MTCAVCHIEVQPMVHHFHEGLCTLSRAHGECPVREWTITAPLYFKANEDNTAMIEAYCGPCCAAKALI